MTGKLYGGNCGKQLSPLSAAIMDHIAARGTARFANMFEVFGAHEGRTPLRKRLLSLVKGRHLITEGEGDRRTWRPALRVPAFLTVAPPAAPMVVSRAPVVPPRRDGPMRGPTYTPHSSMVTRPGAMDFQRCASRGDKC